MDDILKNQKYVIKSKFPKSLHTSLWFLVRYTYIRNEVTTKYTLMKIVTIVNRFMCSLFAILFIFWLVLRLIY